MADDKTLYVILQKNLKPEDQHLSWLPPEYPARCRDVFRVENGARVANAPPAEKHARMTPVEVESLKTRYAREYLIGRHENGYDAKSEEQIKIALEVMSDADKNALRNFSVGASVKHNLNLSNTGELNAAMFAGYNEMQRIKRGEVVVRPAAEELAEQVASLQEQVAELRAELGKLKK